MWCPLLTKPQRSILFFGYRGLHWPKLVISLTFLKEIQCPLSPLITNFRHLPVYKPSNFTTFHQICWSNTGKKLLHMKCLFFQPVCAFWSPHWFDRWWWDDIPCIPGNFILFLWQITFINVVQTFRHLSLACVKWSRKNILFSWCRKVVTTFRTTRP